MAKGEPLYLLDLMRMREGLNVDARGSLRVILDPAPSGNLGIALECCACEELVEWDSANGWWMCPGCEREFTDREVEDLLAACRKAFEVGTKQEQEPAAVEPVKDERTGMGRWLDRVKLPWQTES
jgi:hypothetical protein